MSDYTTVTELPGHHVSGEQLTRLYQRYHFASRFCKDKQVLEAACGSGVGLGLLAKSAKEVVGGDIDRHNLGFAETHYHGRADIKLRPLDAHSLPFPDESFDVVILYEAIYYLALPERFVAEARRILRKGGTVIVGTVNKSWPDFNPSPYSVKYFSAPELHRLLKQKFPQVEIYGGFPADSNSVRDKLVSNLKRTAISLNLMPKTMKGKEIYKRIFFGKLAPLPPEIGEGMAEYQAPVSIPADIPDSRHKVLYAVAKG